MIAARADDNAHESDERLVHRAVELVRSTAGETERAHVTQHAHDFEPLGGPPESLANRVLAWPEFLRHRMVDEHSRRAGAITIVDHPAFQQSDTHRLQVVAIEPAILDQGRLVRAPRRAAF